MQFKKVGARLSILFALGACDGSINGTVRGTGQPVQISYEQGMSSDTLTTTVDGEEFHGKAVMRGATSHVGTGFWTAYAGGTPVSGTTSVFGTATTGDVMATLLGSRGSSLTCGMQYADSSGFTPAGGVGICRHSDGRIIDIVW